MNNTEPMNNTKTMKLNIYIIVHLAMHKVVRWGTRGDGSIGYVLNSDGGHIVSFNSREEAEDIIRENFTDPSAYVVAELTPTEIYA